MSVSSDAAPSGEASTADTTLVVLVAAVLSTAIRTAVELRVLVERASGRGRRDEVDAVAPVVDAAFDVALRATAAVASAAGVVSWLGRPVAMVALRPPILPPRFWPQTRLALAVEHGRRARANAELLSEQVAGDLMVTVLDEVLVRIDLAGIVNQVIDEIDLPEIIRESSGTMASEAVVGMRIRGIAADERVNRAINRVLLRRRASNDTGRPTGVGDG